MTAAVQVVAPPPFVRLAAHPLRWRLLAELARSDRRVRELVARVARPQNLVSYHLRLLRDAGLITASRSSFDGREAYYHLDLDRCASSLAASGSALHPGLLPTDPGAMPTLAESDGPPISVLFLCTGNSARSPIAEALLRHHGGSRVEVTSAGSNPKADVHPGAVAVLRDSHGIDISGQQPRHVDSLAGRRFDYVITVCDRVREVCPRFPDNPHQFHWSIPDPTNPGDTAAFERAATEIETRIRHLLPVLASTPNETQEQQS